MTNNSIPELSSSPESVTEPTESTESTESFGALLAQFEQSHTRLAEDGAKQREGTVVSVSAESVYVDIGFKTEGVLPRAAFDNNAEGVGAGEKVLVSVKGRNEEGYYELSRLKLAPVKDWASLEDAFAQKSAIVGRVTGVVKGGRSCDVGLRAFMPASRSGVRAAEMEKLVDQEITCRIIKL